jgi:hypothetical protein
MTFAYALRVNYFAEEQGRLIVDGIAPAVARAQVRYGPFAVALRRHWHGGPHILIGLGSAEQTSRLQISETLGNAIAIYLETECQPDSAFDPEKFEALAGPLAEVELWTEPKEPLRQNLSVEHGPHFVPLPLGDPHLAGFRDRFKVQAYRTTLDLIRTRLENPATALIDIACFFGSLHHLDWSRGYNLWPYSLLGQVSAAEVQLADHRSKFAAGVGRLGPDLSRRFAARGILGAPSNLDPRFRAWVDGVQPIYSDLADYAYAKNADYFRQVNDLSGGADQLEQERKLRPYLFHPAHFAYRMIMNFHYELIQTVGLSPTMRLLVGFLVRDLLTRVHPEVLGQMEAAGSAMLADGALTR